MISKAGQEQYEENYCICRTKNQHDNHIFKISGNIRLGTTYGKETPMELMTGGRNTELFFWLLGK
jgi:hypothetical protein